MFKKKTMFILYKHDSKILTLLPVLFVLYGRFLGVIAGKGW